MTFLPKLFYFRYLNPLTPLTPKHFFTSMLHYLQNVALVLYFVNKSLKLCDTPEVTYRAVFYSSK